MMKAFMRNNRGAAAILVVILIMGAFGLCMYFQSRTYDTMIEFGARPRAMIETYAYGEQARAYMTNAVGIAANQAFYEAGHSGTYASELCNEPMKHNLCVLHRGDELVDSFFCEAEDIENKNSICSAYEVNLENGFYARTLNYELNCDFVNSVVVMCSEFDDVDKYEFGVNEGVHCEVLVGSNVVELFDCYAGKMEDCGRYGIIEMKEQTVEKPSKVFACEAGNDVLSYVDSFECWGDVNAGCEAYGVEYTEGVQKLTVDLLCEEVAMDMTCSESACGKASGYAVWNKGGQRCVPDGAHIEKTVIGFLDSQFEKILYNFPLLTKGDSLYYAADVNLSVDLEKGTVVAMPIVSTYKSIYFESDGSPNIKEEEFETTMTFDSEHNFTYSISPYFEAELPFNPVTVFEEVASKAESAVGVCGVDADCVKGKVGDAYGFKWTVTSDGEYLLFDLESTEHVVLARDSDGRLIRTGLPVRFAWK